MYSFIKRLFQYLVLPRAVRQGTLPTSADGAAALAITLTAAAAWTFGAWTQIALAAVLTTETQIVGFTLENFVMAAGAQGEVEIGTGVAPAGALLGRYPIVGADGVIGPISVPAATGVVARLRTSTGVADTVDIKLKTKTGM